MKDNSLLSSNITLADYNIWITRPVARIFRGGGGGGAGAYVNNQDQLINIWMIRYASSEDKQGRVSNLRSKSNRDDF